MTVTIPDQAIGDGDLLTPLQSTLKGINLLGDSNDQGSAFKAPDMSVAIIESTATTLTKGWSTVIAAVGGASVVTGAVSAFWTGQSSGIRIALVAGIAGVLAAVAIALAIIISSDVRGRANGASAIYAARAAITVQFLREAYDASAKAAAAPASVPPAQNGAADNGAAVQMVDAAMVAALLDRFRTQAPEGAELVFSLRS